MDDILNKVIRGENSDVMATIATGSIPTVITDPPYGLSFMGKRWDYDVPSVEQFREILRVLKPGGTMLCFAGSRTQHRMACNIEDAGFVLKDCIMWLYGSGFPKATDIPKQIDKVAGVEREVVGQHAHPAREIYQGGAMPAEVDITAPATEAAQLWDGWKSHGLKPAYEPIIVAVKANDGSYANNALVHGVSGLNIDAGRIGTTGARNNGCRAGDDGFAKNKVYGDYKPTERVDYDKGRFPANVILDEQAAAMLDEQSGETISSKGYNISRKDSQNTAMSGKNYARQTHEEGFNDKGGASRFFYCAKASKGERNDGCEGLAAKAGGSMSANEGDSMDLGAASLTGEKIQRQQSKNHHPTVKPLALMEYLCKLTSTPTGGCVLDPFAGSGTTLLAAYNTGRDYIGIERDPEYIKIIEARLNGAKQKLGLFE